MDQQDAGSLSSLFHRGKTFFQYGSRITLTWWQQCLLIWAFLIITLNIIGLLGANVIPPGGGIPDTLTVPTNTVPGIWARFDSAYYLRVAESGYKGTLEEHTLGFFPLFPLLTYLFSRLTRLSLPMAGMIIAQGSYLAAILLFYRLARVIHDDHGYAIRSTLFFVLFPTSFFYLAIYGESLYITFAILTVSLVLRPQPHYSWSGLACGLASLTRPVGWLFNLVLLSEFARRRDWQWRWFILLGLGLFVSVVGVGLYIAYTYTLTGSWLAIPNTQALWQRSWQLPWLTYGQCWQYLLWGNGIEGDWFLAAINGVDLAITTLGIGLTVAAAYQAYRQQYPWSLVIYLAVSMLFLLAQRGPNVVPCWAMSRWVGALFPLFFVLGNTRKTHFWQITAMFLSGGLLLLTTAWWASGRWVG